MSGEKSLSFGYTKLRCRSQNCRHFSRNKVVAVYQQRNYGTLQAIHASSLSGSVNLGKAHYGS